MKVSFSIEVEGEALDVLEKLLKSKKDKSLKPSFENVTDIGRIGFLSEREAEETLTVLKDYVHHYERVSVSEYCELVGADGTYADIYFGWNDLDDAKVKISGVGYVLDLPEPRRISGYIADDEDEHLKISLDLVGITIEED